MSRWPPALRGAAGPPSLALVVVGVDLGVPLPLVGELVLGEAGIDRAGLDARVAVDALLGIDVQLRLVVDHLGMNPEGLAAAVRLGAMVKATPRVKLDVSAVDPAKLMFGSDLPGTRTTRTFGPSDLDLPPAALAENARRLYLPA